MQLVVEISEDTFFDLKKKQNRTEVDNAVLNGTPLDKIRAEIEQTVSRYSISRECGCMGHVEWSDRLIKESDVLQVIDKYKAESEGSDANSN